MFAVLSPIDLSAVVVVAGVVMAALFHRGKRLELSIGKVKAAVDDAATHAAVAAVKADEAARTVEAVNHAVNNRPAGDPTLYEQVRAIGLKVDDNTAATHANNRRVTEIASLVTAHIAQHQAEQDRR